MAVSSCRMCVVGEFKQARQFASRLSAAMFEFAGAATGQGGPLSTTEVQSTVASKSASLISDATIAASTTVPQAVSQNPRQATLSILGIVLRCLNYFKNTRIMFDYVTNRWGLLTFIFAALLSRAQFFSSPRRSLRLKRHVRLAVYLIPILLFTAQLLRILEALKCQTSPDYPLMRYDDPLKKLTLDFSAEGGFLYNLSSSLLFWKTDGDCCNARHMSLSSVSGKRDLRGSLSALYPLFVSLCFAQFLEAMVCALQGRRRKRETAMSIFELSLVFSECQTMITNSVGLGFLGPSLFSSGHDAVDGEFASPTFEIMQRLNIPPEVLLICLITCFNHLSSAILGAVNIRHKVRLINTGIWACCYMAAIIFCKKLVLTDSMDRMMFRIPILCVVIFMPCTFMFLGILFCCAVYGAAIFITALSLPEDVATDLTFHQKLRWAYRNSLANLHFTSAPSFRVNLSEDFYSAVSKVGFAVLTAASTAVYLNEGCQIQVGLRTWLEQKRMDSLAESIERRGQAIPMPQGLLGNGTFGDIGFVDHQDSANSKSPYAIERKTETGDDPRLRDGNSSPGFAQRYRLTRTYWSGVLGVYVTLQARFLVAVLGLLGIRNKPGWLLRAAAPRQSPARFIDVKDGRRAFRSAGRGISVYHDEDADITVFLSERLGRMGPYQEEELDYVIYQWWSRGGWFGNVDHSCDYQPPVVDEDLTSVLSLSTTEDTSDEEDGRRTPTQRDISRKCTLVKTPGLDFSFLARLLDPQNPADREEARLLSYRFQSPHPMTRDQYRRISERSQSQVLHGPLGLSVLSEEDEEKELEKFILGQRRSKKPETSTWETGGEGMGDSGPACVICQCSPRTTLVWPCGCLSLCDECRIGLAARNHTKCVCCRTNVVAFSRMYVP
ncbi:hypothetical protein K470DRAFT_256648 [Piedraia hortae CBS 480.64]|uniref:RING-type domain-containing protein n=1 Tax=Piedraia hortae CBS 480.64 TaxID=1314780 RepID=A0A6A7C2K3_9PEZI|nr:hypothetical protein K470DRAFT_256648 [Piedraia hortae CBS 480.64]